MFVQWNNHSRSPVFSHYTTLKGSITESPDLVHYYLGATLYNLSRNLIFPFLNFPTLTPPFRFPNWRVTEVITCLNTISGLQPSLEHPCYTNPQNIPSKSFGLYHLPVPASHLDPLFYYNFAPFPHSLANFLRKQLSISTHIGIHLPSKLCIYLLFALIPFNLSLSSM